MRSNELLAPAEMQMGAARGRIVIMSEEPVFGREESDDDLDGEDDDDIDLDDSNLDDDDGLDDDELEQETEERAKFKEKLDTEFPLSGGETEEDL